jgi:hypothetical protein
MSKRGWIVVISGAALLLVGAGTLLWLDRQPPVLARSAEVEPLSGYPLRVTFNPLRDRSPERLATQMVEAIRLGGCRQELAPWFRDYRRGYAEFLCNAEQQHPLVAFRLFDRQEQPPLVILHYKAVRRNGSAGQDTYTEDLFITTQATDSGGWAVTKYGALY